MPINSPTELVDEYECELRVAWTVAHCLRRFKKSGEFDRLRRELLIQFRNSVGLSRIKQCVRDSILTSLQGSILVVHKSCGGNRDTKADFRQKGHDAARDFHGERTGATSQQVVAISDPLLYSLINRQISYHRTCRERHGRRNAVRQCIPSQRPGSFNKGPQRRPEGEAKWYVVHISGHEIKLTVIGSQPPISKPSTALAPRGKLQVMRLRLLLPMARRLVYQTIQDPVQIQMRWTPERTAMKATIAPCLSLRCPKRATNHYFHEQRLHLNFLPLPSKPVSVECALRSRDGAYVQFAPDASSDTVHQEYLLGTVLKDVYRSRSAAADSSKALAIHAANFLLCRRRGRRERQMNVVVRCDSS